MIKTVIGIISYNDLLYLKKTLPVLSELPDSKIVILDNAHNDEVQKFVTQNYPEIDFIRHSDGNLGFGRGHNYIVLKSPPSEYFFCLNNDILLDPDTYKKCISHLDKNNDICMVSAKLHHWDFANNRKTNIIDTLGIVGNYAHHFWDRGQGKEDVGQFDNSINQIFGISGAAFFIRRNCIPKLHGNSTQIFDENFFMYKEDIDLAYRMRWQDMKIDFLPYILGYHDRTVNKKKRKSKFEATQSYKNHIILLRNNFSSKFSFKIKYQTFIYEFFKFFYYMFSRPKLLKEFFNAFKIKIHKSKRTISPRKMKKYLLK